MSRLTMMEMRMLLAYFVWHFDAELVRLEEPVYEDIFIATRGPLERRVKPSKTRSELNGVNTR